MVRIPGGEGRGTRLGVRRILAVFIGCQAFCKRPSMSARLAVAVPSGLERKVTGGAWDSSFSHLYTAPWSEVQASSNQEHYSRRRPSSSAGSVARTLPASVVRRRRSNSNVASRSCMPSTSRLPYSGPRVRSLPRRRRSVVHACCTLLGIAPTPPVNRSSRRRTFRRGPWAAWMRNRGQVSGPPVSRRCLGQRLTSRSSCSVPLPRGRCGGPAARGPQPEGLIRQELAPPPPYLEVRGVRGGGSGGGTGGVTGGRYGGGTGGVQGGGTGGYGGVRGGGTGGGAGGGYGGEVRGVWGGGVRRGGTGGEGYGGFGGSHTRRCKRRAVHTQGGAPKRRSVATAGVLLFKGPRARRYTRKAVHTQGGAHQRRPVATTRVLLFKGPWARRYTRKAVHTKGGL